jgi:energy-coupling factor transporter transmembrane protein EcfT
VAVGAALACNPDVLLLDEPTSGQDAEHIEAIMAAIDARPKLALVFATHDLGLVEKWGTRTKTLEAHTPPHAQPTLDRVSWLDPRTRLLLLLTLGLWAVLIDAPMTLAALAVLAAIPFMALPIGWTWRRRGLVAAGLVVWTTIVSQGLFYADLPRTPWFSVGPLTVFREGVLYGLIQSLRMITVSFAGIAVAVSTPTDRLQQALTRLRVPWALSFLAGTALRIVPRVGREWWVVRAARARRGRPLQHRMPIAWLRTEVWLLVPVVARTLRRARRLAISLDARGFDPDYNPTPLRPLRLTPPDVVVGAAALATTGVFLVAETLFLAYTLEVAYFPALRPLYGMVRTWL